MKLKSNLLAIMLIPLFNGCAVISDDLNAITAFNPYITKDGKQSFRFVASSTLPSYYGDADIQQVHESLISNELGRRQYCIKGYEIVSKSNPDGEHIIYEGACK